MFESEHMCVYKYIYIDFQSSVHFLLYAKLVFNAVQDMLVSSSDIFLVNQVGYG